MSGILCFINCRGDKAFCSTECRENFMEDEMEEGEPMIYHPAPPSSSPLDNGPFFQLIRWVKISNNLIWSCLKCCLRLISCSHGCDHVCGVVAWRFCLCSLPHLLISLFCVLGSSNFLEDLKNDYISGHIIILIGEGCVRMHVWTWVWLFGPHFQWLSDVRRFCYYHVSEPMFSVCISERKW